ncbi:hypothetical protein HPB50_026633 [Hyalomma asiaticum]|uniref:Uncharacterized protein n=1 Tax=Hyalomma asiaticum TaxID=266040 RepID=A0ACB7SZB9_HYAAI|nr:hypothetical protein HPB50_026633 [Hyalomma asiaticum]
MNAGSNARERGHKRKIIRRSRMPPPLPKKEAKTIVRGRAKGDDAVLVLFYVFRVPNFAFYGGAIVRCTLLRKHMDVRYPCGRLGHCSDVCPLPNDAICRGCGETNPDAQRKWDTKCKLCGRNHLTAVKDWKRRFQTPPWQASPIQLQPLPVQVSWPLQEQHQELSSLHDTVQVEIQIRFQESPVPRTTARLHAWSAATDPHSKPGPNSGGTQAPRDKSPPENSRDMKVIRLRKENDDPKT